MGKTVLVVTNTLRGGTGSHLVRLLGQFDPDRWKALVLCHGGRDLDPPEHIPLIAESRPQPLNRFPLAQLRQFVEIRRAVARHEPALLHAFFFWPIMYGRLLKQSGSIRHLVENREDQGFIWSTNDYRLLRATAGVPDRIICVSEAVREVVIAREGVSEDRTEVIHNGISLPSWRPTRQELDSVRAEFGFSARHRIVGMVANLQHAVKGAGYLVDAVPLIVQQVPEARFLVVGEGREKDSLQARAQELGVGDCIVFAGFKHDMPRFYPIMDVSVLTSLSEGLSITILESMSFGLPVVATHVGGNPELVRHRETGFLVPPKDVSSFAKAVVCVLSDPGLGRRMGERGRAIVESGFALSRVAERYQQLYSDVLQSVPNAALRKRHS